MAKLSAGKSSPSGLLKGRWTMWSLAIVFALLTGFGLLTIVGKAADQSTYYVLKADVAARVQITQSMLDVVSTSTNGVPPTALKAGAFVNNNLFTKIALKKGDVVTSSVVGNWQPLTANLPAGFMIASIKVAPEDAVGGRIKAGDYIDVAEATTGSKSIAKIVLHHVLVLDVTVAPTSVAQGANANTINQSGTGPDSPSMYAGIPQLYTLAVSTNDFLVLTATRSNSLYLGISSSDASGTLSNGYLDSTSILAPGSVPDAGTVLNSAPTATK